MATPPPEEEEEEVEGEERGASNMPPVEQVELQAGGTNFPAIWSEEGKYLASVLGDALVKGLSLVSQERPNDPVEYLSRFLRKYKEGEGDEGGVAVAGGAVAGTVAAAAVVEEEEDEPMAEEDSGVVEETPVQENEPVEEAEVVQEDAPAEEVTAEEPPPEVESSEEKVEEPEQSAPQEEEPPAQEEPPVANEENLETELTEGYDKLEDALEEEEASASPFDPEKEEQAERAMIEMNRGNEPGEDGDVNAFSGHNSTRDENGQSVLHFACTRPGGGSTISAFLQNPSVNLAWRDVNLRTARDVASNLGRVENVRVVDNYIVQLAQRGDFEALEALLVDGYEHLADVEDLSGVHVVEVADNADHKNCAQLLRSAPEFRERVERVQRCVRSGDIDGVKSLISADKRVGYAINPKTGRNSLHVAVLCEEIGIVKWIAENCVEAVKKTDNLERTCLHLSMGVDKCEKIVRILVRAGAKRVVKDLRDRQPSYYFLHKDEIGELQAEERAIVN